MTLRKTSGGRLICRPVFAILQIMLRAGKGFIDIAKDANGDWKINLSREKDRHSRR